MNRKAVRRRVRIEDIPTQPLDDLFHILLANVSDATIRHSRSGVTTPADRWRHFVRLKQTAIDDARRADSLNAAAEANGRMKAADDQLVAIRADVERFTSELMSLGKWLAIGSVGRRRTLIPRAAWVEATLNWRERTLVARGILYTKVSILSERIADDLYEAVRQLDVETNAPRELASKASEKSVKIGRPTVLSQSLERFRKMEREGELKSTLSATAEDIGNWFSEARPADQPRLKTIENHIRAAYDEAKKSGKTPKPNK